MEQANRSIFKQTMWVWFFTILVIRLTFELESIPFLKEYLMPITAGLLIYVPLLVFWKRKERLDFIENTWPQLLKNIGWFLLFSILVMPVVEIGNRYLQELVFHRHYVGGHYRNIWKVVGFQLAMVALPEEFFFRGYFQTQMNRVWGTPYKLLGAKVGKSLLFTSLLFAFSHSLIQQQWWHFSIFFPALAFGWLREKTGSITASILFHALSNVYSYWVSMNYR